MSFGESRMPIQKEERTLDWVVWGDMEGWENQQPQYYDYLSKMSSKNNSILEEKNKYVYGKGFVPVASKKEKVTKIQLNAFLNKINKSKVFRKLVTDGNKYNAFAAEMIFDIKGEKVFPHFLPIKNIRVSKDEYNEKNELLPKVYYYTSDWSKGRKAKDNKDFVEFHPFEWDAEKLDLTKRYVVYWKGDQYEDEYYSEPTYLGGVPYIDADCEVGNFVKNNTKNGFTGGYMVNFYNGTPTEEQKADIKKQFDSVLHGTDNAGKSVKSFNENNAKGVEITPLTDNGQDDRFISLNEQIRDEIFTAHRVSPLLVGIGKTGGLSNNADELRTVEERFTNSYVYPSQEVYNEFVNNILEFNEIIGEAKLQRLDPIKPSITIDFVKDVATRSELRKIARDSGYELPEINDELESSTALMKRETIREFSDEEKTLIDCFAEICTNDSELNIICKRESQFSNVFEAKKSNDKLVFEFATRNENSLLKLLSEKPDLSNDELAQLLKVKPSDIASMIDTLNADGLLEGTNVTEQGETEIKDNEIFVVYKYELRSDAPPLEGVSREFCIDMVEKSKTKSWTIEQIQEISNRVGYDVFSRRGGWYHNPRTEKNTPYCRHIFSQRLVRKK